MFHVFQSFLRRLGASVGLFMMASITYSQSQPVDFADTTQSGNRAFIEVDFEGILDSISVLEALVGREVGTVLTSTPDGGTAYQRHSYWALMDTIIMLNGELFRVHADSVLVDLNSVRLYASVTRPSKSTAEAFFLYGQSSPTPATRSAAFDSTGSFSFELTGLLEGQVGFAIAQATQVDLNQTVSDTIPLFYWTRVGAQTLTAGSLTKNSATLNGSVNPSEDVPASRVGFVYGLQATLSDGQEQVADSLILDITGLPGASGSFADSLINALEGPFSQTIENLSPGAKYYYTAFVSNEWQFPDSILPGQASGGVTFGDTLSFSTKIGVAADSTSLHTTNSVRLHGTVGLSLGAPAAATGFGWSGASDLTGAASVAGNQTTGPFTADITGLSPGSAYYFDAFATNDGGTQRSDTLSFATLVAVNTLPATDLTGDAGTLAGSFGTFGSASPTGSGFVWGKDSTLADGVEVSLDSTSGNFAFRLEQIKTDTTYYFSAFALNSAGKSYGDTLSFVPPWTCGTSPIAFDGYMYGTVRIGDQCWFSENLRSTSFHSGDPIPADLTKTEWKTTTGPAVSAYADSPDSAEVYGLLYNWYAVNDARGLCPAGWRVPSGLDWDALRDTLGGADSAHAKLKSAPTDSVAWTGTNLTGFSALPGGRRANNGVFTTAGTYGVYWTADERNSSSGRNRVFATEEEGLATGGRPKRVGASVRCLQAGLPRVNTLDVATASDTSMFLQGWVLDDGGDSISDQGFLWGVQSDLSDAVDAGAILNLDSTSVNITGLTKGTTYFFVAYATNRTGTSYGDTLTFVPKGSPIVTTSTANPVAQTTATLQGTLSNAGGGTVEVTGFKWGRTANLADGQLTVDSNQVWTMSHSLNCLERATTYYYSVYATNEEGTTFGDTLTFTTSGLDCGNLTVEYGGHTYSTVASGSDCWFAENLQATEYTNGDPITTLSSASASLGSTEGWQTIYADIQANLASHGRLYNGHAVRDARGLCPSGWHLPKLEEWQTLIAQNGGLGGAHEALKSSAADSPAWDGSNASGFSATPAGVLQGGVYFGNLSQSLLPITSSSFWVDLEAGADQNVRMSFVQGSYSFPAQTQQTGDLTSGYSIRCIHDAAPKVFTYEAEDVGKSSALLNGSWSRDRGAPVTAQGFYISTDSLLTSVEVLEGEYYSGNRFNASASDLVEDTKYFYTAFATNCEGTSTGDTLSFVAVNNPCASETSWAFDGYAYDLVSIKDQCWFAQDLRTTHYADGDTIEEVVDHAAWNAATEGAQTLHPDDSGGQYGRLYNDFAVKSSKGLCPTGFHISTDDDWTVLVDTLGAFLAGVNLKSTASDVPAWNGLNTYGFSAVPGGFRDLNDAGTLLGSDAFWWTSTSGTSGLWNRVLQGAGVMFSRNDISADAKAGFSVRCVMSEPSKPVIRTEPALNVTTTTAKLDMTLVHDGWLEISNLIGFIWGENSDLSGGTDGWITSYYSLDLEDLNPGTRYYYSAYMGNPLGITYADTLEFATLIESITDEVSGVGPTTATFHGRVGEYGNVMPETVGFYVGLVPDSATALRREAPFLADTFALSVSDLVPGNTYYYTAFTSNEAGTTLGTWMEMEASDCFLLDYQGYSYNLVAAGDQCWFAENLRTEIYSNGDSIPAGYEEDDWTLFEMGVQNVDPGYEPYLAEFGRLYNYAAATDSRGICPAGWHVSQDEDWKVLESVVGILNPKKIKASPEDSPEWNGTNETGLSLLPSGSQTGISGGNLWLFSGALVWSPDNSNHQVTWRLVSNGSQINRYQRANNHVLAHNGLAIRCVSHTRPRSTAEFVGRTENSVDLRILNLFNGGSPLTEASMKVWPVNSNGSDTLYTALTDISGLDTIPVHFDGLSPQTRYGYKASLSNAHGTLETTPQYFNTPWSISVEEEPLVQLDSASAPHNIISYSWGELDIEYNPLGLNQVQLYSDLQITDTTGMGLTRSFEKTWVSNGWEPRPDANWGTIGAYYPHLVANQTGLIDGQSINDTLNFTIQQNRDFGEEIDWKLRMGPGMMYQVKVNVTDEFGLLAEDSVQIISPPFVRSIDVFQPGQERVRLQYMADSWAFPVESMGFVYSTDSTFATADTLFTDPANFRTFLNQNGFRWFNAMNLSMFNDDVGPEIFNTMGSDESSTDAGLVLVEIENLLMGQTYFGYPFATNAGGTANGDVIEFGPENPCGDDSAIDYYGTTYDLLPLHYGCYFKQNLATDFFNNGDPIHRMYPTIDGMDEWMIYTPAFTVHAQNTHPFSQYSYGSGARSHLYNISAVNDSRGLCPTGFTLLDMTDSDTFEDYVPEDLMTGPGGTENWIGNNSTGFSYPPVTSLFEGQSGGNLSFDFWGKSGSVNYSFSVAFVEADEVYPSNNILHIYYNYENDALRPVRCRKDQP